MEKFGSTIRIDIPGPQHSFTYLYLAEDYQKMGPKVELRGEDVIQAVVVADSFSGAFAPLTLSSPGCLLPLAGRPLLEYTLEVRVLHTVTTDPDPAIFVSDLQDVNQVFLLITF
jgi:hypothetical protein